MKTLFIVNLFFPLKNKQFKKCLNRLNGKMKSITAQVVLKKLYQLNCFYSSGTAGQQDTSSDEKIV